MSAAKSFGTGFPMSYFVRFLLLCCTVALAIPTYANALN